MGSATLPTASFLLIEAEKMNLYFQHRPGGGHSVPCV